MDDLISRAEAVKAALELYHRLQDKQIACRDAADSGGVMVYTAAAEIAQAMVRQLMELPEMDAVKVVRCADCILGFRIPEQPNCVICGNMGIPVALDWYCKSGRTTGGEASAAE